MSTQSRDVSARWLDAIGFLLAYLGLFAMPQQARAVGAGLVLLGLTAAAARRLRRWRPIDIERSDSDFALRPEDIQRVRVRVAGKTGETRFYFRSGGSRTFQWHDAAAMNQFLSGHAIVPDVLVFELQAVRFVVRIGLALLVYVGLAVLVLAWLPAQAPALRERPWLPLLVLAWLPSLPLFAMIGCYSSIVVDPRFVRVRTGLRQRTIPRDRIQAIEATEDGLALRLSNADRLIIPTKSSEIVQLLADACKVS